MAEIEYPSTIKTDYEKLCAVYSLIEQLRLEHNQQGAIARSDWSKYREKWYLYALRPRHLGGNIFGERLLPLLKERNSLRDKIWQERYTDEQWREMTDSERDIAYLQMYGDRQVEQAKPTKAKSVLLDELKAISLDNLAGVPPPDPIEDFTTYTLYPDPNSYITISSVSEMSCDNLPTDADVYAYKDYGDGHFSGDYEHLFDSIPYISRNSNNYVAFHGLGTTLDDWYNIQKWQGTFLGEWATRLGVQHTDNGWGAKIQDYWTGITQGTRYWFNLERSGTTLTLKIYSDNTRTTLEDTPTVTCSTQVYRYCYGLQSIHYTSDIGNGDADLKNLDLQEGGEVTEKTSSETGSGADLVLTGHPQAAISRAETGSGVELKADYPGGEITGFESGKGSESAALLVVIAPAGDDGMGAETSSLDTTEYTVKFGSDTGTGSGISAAVIAQVTGSEAGGGAESVMDRVLILAESGAGAESSVPVVVWTAVDAGVGIESSLLVPVFFSNDMGLGSELSMMLKDICGGDEGKGSDALKALIGSMGAGSDMRLHGRPGKARMPSKGVNI